MDVPGVNLSSKSTISTSSSLIESMTGKRKIRINRREEPHSYLYKERKREKETKREPQLGEKMELRA